MKASLRVRPGLSRTVLRRGLIALAAAGAMACNGKTIDFDTDTPSVSVVVTPDVRTDSGVNGELRETMSTAFASAVWQRGFFVAHPDEGNPDASPLSALAPQRVLVQVYDSPLQGSPNAPVWDFSELDAIVQPLLQLGQEPIIQIIYNQTTTPSWLDPSSDPSAFAEYCANIVRYYNSDGGVTLPDGGAPQSADGGVLRSPSGKRIAWWAILSDPNTVQGAVYSSGAGYESVYMTAAARMSSVDPLIQFAAPEFNDCYDNFPNPPSASCQPAQFVQAFLDAIADAGPTEIGALSLHMFSTNFAVPEDSGVEIETDLAAFQTVIPKFANDVSSTRQQLMSSGHPETPVWITESQINSDSPLQDGTSDNYHYNVAIGFDPPTDLPFRGDRRGTDFFFAAWRPAMFSRLGKAGASGLFQWQYTAGHCPSADAGCSTLDTSDTDNQNAEIDYNSGTPYLSYWVDFELSHKFASDPNGAAGQSILRADVTALPGSNASIEALATRRSQNGKDVVVVMVVNTTVLPTGPAVDGPGQPETAIVDLSALLAGDLGSAWSASLMRIDAAALDASTTDLTAPPREVPISLSSPLVRIPFAGYGVAFLTLTRSN